MKEMQEEVIKVSVNPILPSSHSDSSIIGIEARDLPGTRVKMEELFQKWLSMDRARDLIQAFIQDAQVGKSIDINVSQALPRSPTLKKKSLSRNTGKRDAVDGLSPSKHQEDQIITKDIKPDSSNTEKRGAVERLSPSKRFATDMKPDSSSIPKFYFGPTASKGRAKKISTDALEYKLSEINTLFAAFPDGILVDDFVAVSKDLCRFPSFFNAPLFDRILSEFSGKSTVTETYSVSKEERSNSESQQRVTKDAFIMFWRSEIEPYDYTERFFRLVKKPGANCIVRSDFEPFLQELLTYHPGLEFLSGTSEFQEKYAVTVVVRIFYDVDIQDSGRISLRDLRRSRLIEAFNHVDEEEDINKVNRYFSYEHFYVLYCKFWELDSDHDFQLSRDDLMRYGGHALTRAIVDRIFDLGKRPFGRLQLLTHYQRNLMSYEDFIYFIVSEEDKANLVSLDYWFSLVDINEDGVIRADEMRYFYCHQVHRMESLGHEIVSFEDIMCQMCDLLKPMMEGEFRMSDFVKPDKIRVAGVFFNVLFNLGKFMAYEQRDPFLLRQQMAEPELTDWDRFARVEYAHLAMEGEGEGNEDENDMDIDSMDGWYVSEAEEDPDEYENDAGVGSSSAEAPF